LTGCFATSAPEISESHVPSATTGPHEQSQKLDNTWFSEGSFRQEEKYIGKAYTQQLREINKDELVLLLRQAKSYSNWEMLLNNGVLLKYSYEDIDYFSSVGNKEVYSYDFSRDFGENIAYSRFYDGSGGLIVDYRSNVLAVFRQDIDSKVVANAIKFDHKHSLSELTYLGSFKEQGRYKAVFRDQKVNVYTVDIDSMKLESHVNLYGLSSFSAHTNRNGRGVSDNLNIYAFDPTNRKIIKIDHPSNEISFKKTLDPRIQGDILQIISDGSGGLFILAKSLGKFEIFFTKEEENSPFIGRKEPVPSAYIQQIDYYSPNERTMDLILVDFESKLPLYRVNAYEFGEFNVNEQDEIDSYDIRFTLGSNEAGFIISDKWRDNLKIENGTSSTYFYYNSQSVEQFLLFQVLSVSKSDWLNIQNGHQGEGGNSYHLIEEVGETVYLYRTHDSHEVDLAEEYYEMFKEIEQSLLQTFQVYP
jgi:hypothetical protein